MPEVDFMVLCDYVRGDGPLMHLIAAGIDRIYAQNVPTAHNLGIATRLRLTRAECDRKHLVEFIFQDQDGQRLLAINAEFEAQYSQDVPPGWPAFAILPVNVGLPLPRYGVYSMELLVDGQSKKSIEVVVSPPPSPPAGT